MELMVKVHDMVYRKEIKEKKVPGEDKIYSIYERTTYRHYRERELGSEIRAQG